MDPDIKELFQTLINGQIQTDKSVNELAKSVDQLATTVTRYIDAADARMKRIEENLDGLIRAIAQRRPQRALT